MVNQIPLSNLLKQYRNTHWIENNKVYGQVTISQTGEVRVRGSKEGAKIGRKRQFFIDLKNHPNTLIFIRQGVFNGGIGLAPQEVNGCTVTENMPMFDIKGVLPEYLVNYLKSPLFKKDIKKLVPLGTAQKAIHENKLLTLTIPLPTEKEQMKVIDKINRIKEIQKVISNNIESNEKLLNNLRQSILQDAIQGKLVRQDPKDEPASVLLERIKKEKEKLIKEGKIKKEKSLPPITEKEKPFQLPKGWEWVRLSDICNSIFAGGDKPSDFTKEQTSKNKIPVIANGVTNNGVIGYTKDAKIFDKSITVSGRGTIGFSYIRETPYFPIVRLLILIPNKDLNLKFLNYSFSAMLESGLGTSIPQLTVPMIRPKLIPLAPLCEQKKIVEKVDKLISYCNELENNIKQNECYSDSLIDAVLRESFSGG